jgi:hypothetical protein
MEVFDDRDEPYLKWLDEHPEGYVLKRRRGKSDSYLVLHSAACRKIRDYNDMAKPDGFTGRSYIKVCAESIDELRRYAMTKGGRPDGSFSGKCSTCNPI